MHLKKDNDIVVMYVGPAMGNAWYAARGWIEYRGDLPLYRLDLVDGTVVELPAPVEERMPRVISKLKLYDELLLLGLWETVRTALEEAGIYERWLLAHDVGEDDPGFRALCTQLVSLLPEGITLDSLLERCVMEAY